MIVKFLNYLFNILFIFVIYEVECEKIPVPKRKFLKDKICYTKKIWGNKICHEVSDTKSSLVFNWVMFLGGFSVQY